MMINASLLVINWLCEMFSKLECSESQKITKVAKLYVILFWVRRFPCNDQFILRNVLPKPCIICLFWLGLQKVFVNMNFSSCIYRVKSVPVHFNILCTLYGISSGTKSRMIDIAKYKNFYFRQSASKCVTFWAFAF